jgi:hypothetical protein
MGRVYIAAHLETTGVTAENLLRLSQLVFDENRSRLKDRRSHSGANRHQKKTVAAKPHRWGRRTPRHQAANSSNNAFASFRSRVSNPSVNHP